MNYRKIRKFRPKAVVSDRVYYLMERKNLGVWTFEPFFGGLMIHADMGPDCRGKSAVKSARAAFAWVFSNTEYAKIYAGVPNSNRPAQMMASWAGMKLISTSKGYRGYAINKGE